MTEKQQTIYVAHDGVEFKYKQNCEKYEAELADKKSLYDRLRPNDDVDYTHAIRQDKTVVREVIDDFIDVVAKYFPVWEEWLGEYKGNEIRGMGIGRYLDDGDEFGILYGIYCRLSCIDLNTGIEYDQQYHANHPDEFIRNGGTIID